MGIFAVFLLLVTVPASAQIMGNVQNSDTAQLARKPIQAQRSGETAQSTASSAGLRQSREQVARELGIKPMARVDNRIQNRIQARIRNRIDRYYDPKANATSPFSVAGDQLRKTGKPR